MWNWLKSSFGGKAAGDANAPEGPDIPWIPADENPWKVPVLDVRPLTLGVISTSSNPLCATNAISFGNDDGTGFIGHTPPVNRSIPADLCYRRDRLLADGALFLPRVMEHKWAIYHHAGKILFIRSWWRKVHVSADLLQEGDGLRVVRVDGAFFESPNESPGFTIRTVDYLLRSHALKLPWPAPLPPGMEQEPRAAATWCFSAFGSLAHFATPHEPVGDRPDAPLRSHSLLHMAAARGDCTAVATQLRLGVPIDLLAADGLPPLQWALATEGVSMLDFLVSSGSPVDVRSAEGATALMTEAQGGSPEKVQWLLAHGADPNARDHRGFTALHRAAEMGSAPLVEVLLSSGANPRVEATGRTAITLAEARGHREIVRLLDGTPQ